MNTKKQRFDMAKVVDWPQLKQEMANAEFLLITEEWGWKIYIGGD